MEVRQDSVSVAAQKTGGRPPLAALLAGYGLAVVCLAWVLHDIHPAKALRELAQVDWRWIALGMLFDVAGYVVQGIRWELLLRPFRKVPVSRTVRAIFVGLFANMLLPLRPGELLRTYLLNKTEKIGFGNVLGSVGVERLIDMVVATSALGAASVFVPLPPHFKKAADALGVVAFVLVAVLLGAVVYFELTLGNKSPKSPPSTRWGAKFMAALVGLHKMGTAPSFYLAVLTSTLTPALQVLGLWAVMQAYGLPLSLPAAVVVLLVINIGVSLPSAPANVGSYQFFCVLGLSIFEVEKTTAVGFSIIAFIALTLPLLFLGFAAALRSGLSVREMRERIQRLPDKPCQMGPDSRSDSSVFTRSIK
jgi:glycosyltransferase 2 family protein